MNPDLVSLVLLNHLMWQDASLYFSRYREVRRRRQDQQRFARPMAGQVQGRRQDPFHLQHLKRLPKAGASSLQYLHWLPCRPISHKGGSNNDWYSNHEVPPSQHNHEEADDLDTLGRDDVGVRLHLVRQTFPSFHVLAIALVEPVNNLSKQPSS